MPPRRQSRQPKPDMETNTAPDAIASDLRRTDFAETPPDSLRPAPEDPREKLAAGGGFTPAEDGGVEQHPIHDDDLEDAGPEEYERELDRLDAAARSER